MAKKKEPKKHAPPDPGTRWKVTFYVNLATTYPAGWSETYHLKAIGYVSAILMAKNIWTVRAATLAPDCTLVYAFVSDEGIKGDSQVVGFTDPTTRVGSYAAEHTLPPWNTVLLREESGAMYRSIRPVRGIPDSEVLWQGFPSPGYLTALAAYAAVVRDNCFNRVFKKDTDKSDDGEYRAISSFTYLRFSERRDGRPFGLRHGSSRKPGATSRLAAK